MRSGDAACGGGLGTASDLVRRGGTSSPGTRWLGDRLAFTDILAGTLPEAVATRPGDAGVDVPLGAVAPVAGRPGEWIAAAGPGSR
jgi:hypothetical protein